MRLFIKSFVCRGFGFTSSLRKAQPGKDLFGYFNQKIVESDSIGVMPQGELVKLVNEFYSNYPVVSKHPELEKKLQETLTSRVKSMSLKEGVSVIESLTVKSRFSAGIQSALTTELMALVLLHKSAINVPTLKTVSNLITIMVKAHSYNDKIFEVLINEFSPEYIGKLNAENLSLLCDVLSRIGMQNKYFDVKVGGKISIYQCIEDKLRSNINSLHIRNLFKILKCLVINDRGDEDLIRRAEKKVFSRVLLLEDKELSDIPFFYQKRVMFPSDYLIDNVYKPVYNEFTRRFEQVNPLSKTLFLVNYWKNSTFHGMYCDNLLTEKIKNELSSGVLHTLPNNKLKQHTLTTCLSYMAHARQLEPNTIENYIDIVKGYKNTFDDNFFMRSAIYLSRYPVANPIFWEIFSTKFKKLSENPENYEQLYTVWLNCRLKDPRAKEILGKQFTDTFVKSITEKWKNSRKKDLVHGDSSHKHKEASKVLRNMNVRFVTEYYDEYFIDIVLPDYKIGIEISGPGHFLFPALILNGRSESRKQTLERLGWKIHVYPYFYKPEDNEGIVKFLNDILPLDFK